MVSKDLSFLFFFSKKKQAGALFIISPCLDELFFSLFYFFAKY